MARNDKLVGLDKKFTPVFQDIARFRGLIFDSLLHSHGMTMSQGWVLFHLVRENGLNQSELAGRMDIATVTVSKLIDKLEANGFIERRPDPQDRRSNRIYTTDAALEIVKVMTSTVAQLDDIGNKGIDPEKLEIAREVLHHMHSNLKAASANRR